MSLPTPHVFINYKRYAGSAGNDGCERATTIDRIATDHEASFVLAPQTPDLRLHATETSLPIVAQGVTAVDAGADTAGIGLDAVVAAGADGILVDHPEHPQTLDTVDEIIAGCRDAGVASIVHASGVDRARAVAQFEPDWVLFEDPRDIGTGEPSWQADDSMLRDVIDLASPETNVMVGGGVAGLPDVEAGFDCGADAVGVSSAVMTASDPAGWVTGVAEAFDSR